MMQPDQLDGIVRALYDGILVPGGWHHVLRDLRSLTNSEQSVLLVWDKSSDRVQITDSYNADARAIREYESHFSFKDPTKKFIEDIPLGEWYLDALHMGVDAIKRNNFYQTFMRSHELGSIMSAPLLRHDQLYIGVSFQGGLSRSRFGETEADVMKPLMPHLQRAVSLQWRFQELSRHALLGQRVLDSFQLPVFVVNAGAKICFSNRAGEAWLSSQKRPCPAQRSASTKNSTLPCPQLARRICGTERGKETLGLRVVSDGTSPAAYLIGLPLTDAHPLAMNWTEPVGLVVVHQQAEKKSSPTQLLRGLFGLTSAEIRLAQALANQDSLSETAAALAISRETARSQLKSVFRKTGMRKQSQLIRLIDGLSQIT